MICAESLMRRCRSAERIEGTMRPRSPLADDVIVGGTVTAVGELTPAHSGAMR
jgi:hypothetical protein